MAARPLHAMAGMSPESPAAGPAYAAAAQPRLAPHTAPLHRRTPPPPARNCVPADGFPPASLAERRAAQANPQHLHQPHHVRCRRLLFLLQQLNLFFRNSLNTGTDKRNPTKPHARAMFPPPGPADEKDSQDFANSVIEQSSCAAAVMIATAFQQHSRTPQPRSASSAASSSAICLAPP